MKSNVATIDRPPRTGVLPGAPRWRVRRVGDKADPSTLATRIWFTPPPMTRPWPPPNVEVAGHLSDEQLDLLRLAFATAGPFQATAVAGLLGDAALEAERRRRCTAAATREWKVRVGLQAVETVEDLLWEEANEDAAAREKGEVVIPRDDPAWAPDRLAAERVTRLTARLARGPRRIEGGGRG